MFICGMARQCAGNQNPVGVCLDQLPTTDVHTACSYKLLIKDVKALHLLQYLRLNWLLVFTKYKRLNTCI